MRHETTQHGEAARVATNVITGFLGAGKSTAILHLLRHKPPHERWAVLVNEFGEVGIDGSLLAGCSEDQQGVFVREVPGGCMCCASGIPMQLAMHLLLAQAKPDRLLIEPTGLGHPKEVLQLLGDDGYRETLDLRATITLVDARKIQCRSYAEHSTFVQQLAVADICVANKADTYEARTLEQLERYLSRTAGLGSKPLFQVEGGALQREWLDVPASRHHQPHGHKHAHDMPSHAGMQLPATPQIPASGYTRIDNRGEGFFSQGWMFDPSWTFHESKLDTLLLGIEAERVKAVFLTDLGVTAYNMAEGVMTKSSLDSSPDSRLEILRAQERSPDELEQALRSCVISGPSEQDGGRSTTGRRHSALE